VAYNVRKSYRNEQDFEFASRNFALAVDTLSPYQQGKRVVLDVANAAVHLSGGLAYAGLYDRDLVLAGAAKEYVEGFRMDYDSPFNEAVGVGLADEFAAVRGASVELIGEPATDALGEGLHYLLDVAALTGAYAGFRNTGFALSLEETTDAALRGLTRRLGEPGIDINVQYIAATSRTHSVVFRDNPDGQVRTATEARELAEEYGIDLDDLEIRYIPDDVYQKVIVAKTRKDSFASFGGIDPVDDIRVPDPLVKFTDIAEQNGKVLVRVRASVLKSDEAIVAVLGHEAKEFEIIGAAFRRNGGALTRSAYFEQIEGNS
jgi:hypothetical protein